MWGQTRDSQECVFQSFWQTLCELSSVKSSQKAYSFFVSARPELFRYFLGRLQILLCYCSLPSFLFSFEFLIEDATMIALTGFGSHGGFGRDGYPSSLVRHLDYNTSAVGRSMRGCAFVFPSRDLPVQF